MKDEVQEGVGVEEGPEEEDEEEVQIEILAKGRVFRFYKYVFVDALFVGRLVVLDVLLE